MNLNKILITAGLSVFTENAGQPPADYAASQMANRGTSFSVGSFKDTGRKLVAAQPVNGVAFVTLSRVNLTDAAKADVKGYQIVAYDLAGNVLDSTPLNDEAPKGTKQGYKVYGAILAAIGKRSDLIQAALHSAREASQARTDLLDELIAECAPTAEAEEAEAVEA